MQQHPPRQFRILLSALSLGSAVTMHCTLGMASASLKAQRPLRNPSVSSSAPCLGMRDSVHYPVTCLINICTGCRHVVEHWDACSALASGATAPGFAQVYQQWLATPGISTLDGVKTKVTNLQAFS